MIAGLCLAGLVGSGCQVAVPKTVIKGSLGGAPFAFTGPKDCTLAGMELTAGSNGVVSIKIQSLNSKNSPDVINASAAGYAAQVKALSDAFAAGAEAVGKATGTAAGTAVKAAVAP